MSDFLPPKKPRTHLKEIPLAPVLDLLTVVVFFLLLSTSFIEFTKETLPPSSTSVITDPSTAVPLSLRVFVVRKGTNFVVRTMWSGATPGEKSSEFSPGSDANDRVRAIRERTSKFADELKIRFATESNVQLGLGSNVTYQEMIAVMDGVREHFDDLVMVSPKSVESKEP